MKMICAWCNKVMVMIDYYEGEPVSHGICPECAESMRSRQAQGPMEVEMQSASDTLAMIEGSEQWWNAHLLEEQDRRDEAQARLETFQFRESLATYAATFVASALILLVVWLCMFL